MFGFNIWKFAWTKNVGFSFQGGGRVGSLQLLKSPKLQAVFL